MTQPTKTRTLNEIDEAGRESFPSSDPPAWTLGTDHDDLTQAKTVKHDLNQLLRREHETIRLVVSAIKKLTETVKPNQAIDAALLQQIMHFFKQYVGKCHHQKEEALFAALRQGDERPSDYILNDLIREHEYSRKLHADLEKMLANSTNATLTYQTVLPIFNEVLNLHRHHTSKEEEYVFPFINKILTKEEREKFLAEFKKIDDHLGANVHANLPKLAEEIKQKVG